MCQSELARKTEQMTGVDCAEKTSVTPESGPRGQQNALKKMVAGDHPEATA
jgi:hypothetical protein